jgi:hypothetical protein
MIEGHSKEHIEVEDEDRLINLKATDAYHEKRGIQPYILLCLMTFIWVLFIL